MCNPALEELYAVPYVETYLDNIENFPDEIQRYLTQVCELHILYQSYISDIENLAAKHQNLTDGMLKKKNLLKAQSLLILAKEVGDEKINIIQQVQDLIESRYNQMGSTFCNLVTTKPETKTVKKETEAVETKKEEPTQEKIVANQSTVSSTNGESTPAPRKRARRKHVDTEKDDVVESSSAPVPRSSATIPVPKKTNLGVPGKKRKSGKQSKVDQDVESTSDKDVPVDPDEPTYCLCKKVSFGSMVMCDNESCPDEWFHFSCVSLTTTPKGKWYCPNCKKNKSNLSQNKKSK